MGSFELALATVREKAKEEKVPFSHLVSAFFLEEILRLIGESAECKKWVLRNKNALSMEAYREKVRHVLAFYYDGSTALKDMKSHLHLLLENNPGTEVRFSVEVTEQGGELLVRGNGRHEKLEVPFEIMISPLPEGLRTETGDFKLIFYPGKRLSLRLYSTEEILKEALFSIVEKLELIGDLSAYELVYDLLGRETVNARHLYIRFLEELTAHGIHPEEGRMKMLEGYKTYPYMKKRWKQYLRGKRKEEPLWEDVLDRTLAFLSPIWDAFVKDTVFFGDWMPDLGRFLI
jgi:hypothetical protein